MSYYYALPLVDEAQLVEARRMLGGDMLRILGYFQEDGAKSIGQIEQAMATEQAAAMVIPAHTLKGESRQFGAQRLGDLAEAIEMAARRCVEQRCAPAEVAAEVAMLRNCFQETLTALGVTGPALALRPYPATPPTPTPLRPAATLTLAPRTFGRRTGA